MAGPVIALLILNLISKRDLQPGLASCGVKVRNRHRPLHAGGQGHPTVFSHASHAPRWGQGHPTVFSHTSHAPRRGPRAPTVFSDASHAPRWGQEHPKVFSYASHAPRRGPRPPNGVMCERIKFIFQIKPMFVYLCKHRRDNGIPYHPRRSYSRSYLNIR